MPLKTESNAEYHASEGVSKTTLWTLYNETPHHARYGARKKRSEAFDIGTVAHTAILEPEKLEGSAMRGPKDRRGNRWVAAQEEADALGKIVLIEDDYDQALLIRDLAATVPELQQLLRHDPIIETSAYHVDEETGCLVKCRPDIYSRGLKMMADVKNLADVSPEAWDRDVYKWGYHMQDAHYSATWEAATGMEVENFIFLCFEKSAPPIVEIYELGPLTKAEGWAARQVALSRYAECLQKDDWPSYGSGVQRREMSRWGFKLTPPPEQERAAVALEDE